MSAAIFERPPDVKRTRSPADREQHFVMHGVSYQSYVTIADALMNQPIRFNYDRGSLELMTVSLGHEWMKSLFGEFMSILRLEIRIKMRSGGSMTFRKEEKQRGLEPDECYWIQHEAQMRFKAEFDPDIDPPPDLMIEIEVSRSILDRIDISAALKIPEIWRTDGNYLKVLLLQPDGQYQESERSRAFPFLSMEKVAEFIRQRDTLDENEIVFAFRDWVRAQVAAGWPSAS